MLTDKKLDFFLFPAYSFLVKLTSFKFVTIDKLFSIGAELDLNHSVIDDYSFRRFTYWDIKLTFIKWGWNLQVRTDKK